jgi:hypothetical protein
VVLTQRPSVQATLLHPVGSGGQSASVWHWVGQHWPLSQQAKPGSQSTMAKEQVPSTQVAAVQGSRSPSTQSASRWQVTGGWSTVQTPVLASQVDPSQQPAPHGSPTPAHGSSQTCWVQNPPTGAQMPQLSLQQNSSGPQTFGPHGSPQNWSVHAPPTGAQMEQLKLQQYWSGPQRTWLQGTAPGSPQRSSEQGVPAGTQMPPQFSQQSVPSRQRMAAQLEVSGTGWQTPAQSAPPAVGSQPSPPASTHAKPAGQGVPVMPPQNAPAPPSTGWAPAR